MKMVKVSIIVPMYNTARYLRECLDTLVRQSLKEIEIVLVNDGSTDETLSIAKEYQKKDRRFKIIDKKNTGYGDSVNKGIMAATGKYIGIVEPDDFCDEKMFEKLFRLAEENKVDMARGGYYHYSAQDLREIKPSYMKNRDIIVEPLENYEVFYEVPAIWSAIYKKSFLDKHGIRLLTTPGASYQDAGFHFKTLACVEKLAYIDDPLYYYRIDNPNSSVKDYKKAMAIVKEFTSIEDFVRKQEHGELLMDYCQVTKFGRYHWNLLRLKKKDAKRFARVMKKDFQEQMRRGFLKRQFFPRKYWFSLRALLLLPIPVYLFLLVVRKWIK